ncbi:MAG: TraI protein [uncultured Sulfurovum sp.]|uniref:TraI protein n=1 Tax=uncultured Sulfurovum sp. TaxID=269237 RepID=A0A6S6U543_9BACT|nr:MAG: TraI protein [uncultured Sulfurovum sp.]
MIVKQVSSKGKGSFQALAAYLLDFKNEAEKVEGYDFSNCPFEEIDENISYIKQMQELNQMVQSDKSLHLVVSFQEEEFPSQEVLADIEMELLKSLNMQEHHRLSVSHNNTNNFHLHIAVNRLNPNSNLLVDPWKSKMKLQKKAEELEEKHKLKKDNHPVQLIVDEKVFIEEDDKRSKIKSNQYKDQEIHSGMKNLLTWIKEEALDEILEVLNNPKSDYRELHDVLAKYNLELKVRANGLVIGDKKRKLFVKASNVHRSLSKGNLEKRFGLFMETQSDVKAEKNFGNPKSLLWEKYQRLMEQRKITKKSELSLEKESRLALRESIKLKYKEQLALVKFNNNIPSNQKPQHRQIIYAHQKEELQELSEGFSQKRKDIHKQNRLYSYKEYLLEKALNGDEKALEALRRTTMSFKANENILRHPQGKVNHKLWQSLKVQITKEGKAVYELEGNGKVIDTGVYLKVTVEDNDRAILTSLQMAKKKYGDVLDVQGSLEFKKRVMMVNERYALGIRFSDKAMRKVQEQENKKGMGL